MRLRYTPQALVELDQVLTEIAELSPQGARRIQQRIQTLVDLLIAYPSSGQLTSLAPMRRLMATPYPYLIFYLVANDEVVVTGIRHGARDPSSIPQI